MQMVRNVIVVLVLLPLVIMFFMPKKELYYLLENRLNEQNIVISGETLKEALLTLNIENPTLYFGGAPLATAKQIDLWSILFYSRVDFHDLAIAEGLPAELLLEKLKATHSVLSPLSLQVAGQSSLGEIEGEVDLKNRSVHINIVGNGGGEAFSKQLKKSDKGWVYESKF